MNDSSSGRLAEALQEWQDRDWRKEVTQALMRVLDLWDVAGHEQLKLLGSSEDAVEYLGRLREGVEILPNDEQSWRRAMAILSIQRSLEGFAPENPEWRDDWVHQPLTGLGHERPLDLMLRQGLPGIERVRVYAKGLGHK